MVGEWFLPYTARQGPPSLLVLIFRIEYIRRQKVMTFDVVFQTPLNTLLYIDFDQIGVFSSLF